MRFAVFLLLACAAVHAHAAVATSGCSALSYHSYCPAGTLVGFFRTLGHCHRACEQGSGASCCMLDGAMCYRSPRQPATGGRGHASQCQRQMSADDRWGDELIPLPAELLPALQACQTECSALQFTADAYDGCLIVCFANKGVYDFPPEPLDVSSNAPTPTPPVDPSPGFQEADESASGGFTNWRQTPSSGQISGGDAKAQDASSPSSANTGVDTALAVVAGMLAVAIVVLALRLRKLRAAE
eukprot:PLAT8836.1.p1 GENE.PLAT8836.1~~PLAT8836.1.p1  ORF type:complete len:254 (-),score=49.74 PLAT8836.1:152-877(-)